MSKQSKETTNIHPLLFLKAIIIGIFGGIIASVVFLFMHTFNMTEIDPFIIFTMFFSESAWFSRWYAYFILIITYAVLSIPIAMVYYLLLKKKDSWFVGAVYGIALWFFIYWVLPLLIKNFNTFFHFDKESHIAMLSLFILYGVFIGYSISYDYESLQKELKK